VSCGLCARPEPAGFVRGAAVWTRAPACRPQRASGGGQCQVLARRREAGVTDSFSPARAR